MQKPLNSYDLSGDAFLKKFFLNLFLAALSLWCCMQAFASCGELGATLHCGEWASHCSGFSYCRGQALEPVHENWTRVKEAFHKRRYINVNKHKTSLHCY